MSLWSDFLGCEIVFVEVTGISTRVISFGEGPPLVLLHGRGGHLESWRANIRPLATRNRVVAFDLLGHGLTSRHDAGYGVDELTTHAASTLDVLGVRDAVLVGQSIGGWVATRLALSRPDLVHSLVLIEPAGLQSEGERLADPKVAAAFARGGRAFSEPTTDAVRDRLAGLVADPKQIDDELVDVRRILYAPPASRAVHLGVRGADNSASLLTPDALAALDIPVLVIHGALANTPLDVVERATAAARARLETVDGAKQWPQLERPDVVNPLITDFVSA